MAALKCDICGGNLMMGAGGIATCDSCGMQHSTDRMKEKVQEIKGAVTVSNAASVESLMKRGWLLLEDAKCQGDTYCTSANIYFNQALDIDPEYAPAYVGKLCVRLWVRSEDALPYAKQSYSEKVQKTARLSDYGDYSKALRFASDAYREKLEGYKQANEAHIQREQEAERQHLEERAQRDREEAQRHLETERIEAQRSAEVRAHLSGLDRYISAGTSHIVALQSNGTVVAAGVDEIWQRAIAKWRNIVAVACGSTCTFGLSSNGKVVQVGKKGYANPYCNTSRWRNIVAISVYEEAPPHYSEWGDTFAVGLRADGTVVTAGKAKCDADNTADWRDIIAVAAGKNYSAGLRSDGTVVAVGYDSDGRCNTADWRDIIAISAGEYHTVGLKLDGTVVVAGSSKRFSKAADWRGIIAIAATGRGITGLRFDGTVVDEDSNQCEGWRYIVSIAVGGYGTIGLKSDGTVAVPTHMLKGEGQSNPANWRNIGPR